MLVYEDKTFTVATGTDQYIATFATNKNMSHEQPNIPEKIAQGKRLRYLSVCSGMEAASVAWHPLGWKPVGFSEIEPFPCAILKHRFPDVPNYGSLTEYQSWPLEPGAIDLLVGGTPCQSFSVAGLRKGLADPRGNLALTFLGLADKLKPKWIIWENVPGVLSSGGGRDFGSFLGALVELGYGFAYRVLDAQYFGVPQRRRRVFVVACLGDWRAAAKVLSLGEGLRGYIEKGRAKGESLASCPQGGLDSNDATGAGTRHEKLNTTAGVEGNNGEKIFGSYSDPNTAFTLETTSHDWSRSDQMTMIVRPDELKPVPYRKSKRAQSTTDNETWIPADVTNTLNNFDLGDTRTTHAVVEPGVYENHAQDSRVTGPLEVAPTVAAKFGTGGGNVPLVGSMSVRRLTCVETERLQGFPDNWSRIPWKGKPAEQCPDGPRYKACGNSMAVPVMAFIGRQIADYENKL